MKLKKQIYKILIVVLVFFVLGLYCLYFYKAILNKKSHLPSVENISLNALPIVAEDVVVQKNYIGHAEAINQVQIIPYITGYLNNIVVKPGQYVKKDDLLLTIDDSEYKAKQIAAEASVLQALAAYDYNQNYYNRVQKTGGHAFSEIEVNNAKNNFLQAQASLKSAQANKKLADIDLNYTQIKAPISGLVGNFNLSCGDYVTPSGSILLNIIQTNPIRVVFSITDKEYLNMKKDPTLFKDSVIKLTLANGQPFLHKGYFKYINNQLESTTNSLAVYAYFDNKDNELLPNSYVTVNIYKTFKNVVLLDKNLVQITADGCFLTIGQQNHIKKVPIQILSEKDNKFVIKNTFQTGDLLVLDDVETIKENASVHFKIQKS